MASSQPQREYWVTQSVAQPAKEHSFEKIWRETFQTIFISFNFLFYFFALKKIWYCVGQFYPGLQQCKGKGPAQYLVWIDTNIRGRPSKERIKLPSEERCSMLARSGDCVRGLWSPRHFCPRCLVSLLITRNSAQDNHITSQRGKYPAKSSGRQ